MFDLTPAGLISRAIALLIAVVVHEFAHAYIAYTQGDNTAYEQGRMTLDPRANVYWPGFLIGVLFGFAILGSAPVNAWRMRNPRLGMLLAVAAGPISNLILAAIFAIPFRFGLLDPIRAFTGGDMIPTVEKILWTCVLLNSLLFVFNFLPLAPLDGWTVVLSALPPRQAIWWERNRQNSTYVLIGIILLSFMFSYTNLPQTLNPSYWLISAPAFFVTELLIGGI